MRRYEVDTVAVAGMLGLAPHVIRNWAARGHIQPIRADGNRTVYDADAVARVAARFGHLPALPAEPENCCCPGCETGTWDNAPVPLCREHAMAVWVCINETLKAKLAPLDELPAPDRPPVVYFIRVGDRIKIGTTIGLRGRLDSIRTMAGHEPEVLLVIPGGHIEERQAHALFAAEHVRGEWFRPSEHLMQFIAERRDLDVRHIEGEHHLPS